MEEHKRSGGIGFCGLLALVFIVLNQLVVGMGTRAYLDFAGPWGAHPMLLCIRAQMIE